MVVSQDHDPTISAADPIRWGINKPRDSAIRGTPSIDGFILSLRLLSLLLDECRRPHAKWHEIARQTAPDSMEYFCYAGGVHT